MTASQKYIEEFKKQQAEWKRMEREKMEAENRRIMEFASYQQRKEENRMANVQERETAKEHLHQMVAKRLLYVPSCQVFLFELQDGCVFPLCSSLRRSRGRGCSARRWSVSGKSSAWRSRRRLQDRKRS